MAIPAIIAIFSALASAAGSAASAAAKNKAAKAKPQQGPFQPVQRGRTRGPQGPTLPQQLMSNRVGKIGTGAPPQAGPGGQADLGAILKIIQAMQQGGGRF